MGAGRAIVVDDPADPRLDDYRGLRDPAGRARVEEHRGVLVAEGVVPIRTLLGSGRRVRSLLLHPRELDRLAADLAAVEAPVYVASRATMRSVAGFDVHRGALAAADRFAPSPAAEVVRGARRLLVIEGSTSVENVGLAFRNAAAFGFGGVLLDPACGDPLTRRAVRVSCGHVLTVPFARLQRLPDGLRPLQEAGVTIAALTPAADAEPLDALRPAAGEALALLVGSEGSGLDAATLAAADRRVRIPLAPGVDSLNLAVAAAIAMHHVADVPG
jgi:tRNA G18 (ribose-2'-O)-methylase SpoU